MNIQNQNPFFFIQKVMLFYYIIDYCWKNLISEIILVKNIHLLYLSINLFDIICIKPNIYHL